MRCLRMAGSMPPRPICLRCTKRSTSWGSRTATCICSASEPRAPSFPSPAPPAASLARLDGCAINDLSMSSSPRSSTPSIPCCDSGSATGICGSTPTAQKNRSASSRSMWRRRMRSVPSAALPPRRSNPTSTMSGCGSFFPSTRRPRFFITDLWTEAPALALFPLSQPKSDVSDFGYVELGRTRVNPSSAGRGESANASPPHALGQLHQLERRAAVGAVGIAQTLAHFEMVEVRRFDQLDRLAGRLHRRGEIAVLALEFRRLIGAVSDDDGRAQSVDLPLRTHRLLHVVGEFDVG